MLFLYYVSVNLFYLFVYFLVVQNRITSFWFSRKELALAFGVTLAFSRLGSVLNFFLTGHLYSVVGLQYTLWIGNVFFDTLEIRINFMKYIKCIYYFLIDLC